MATHFNFGPTMEQRLNPSIAIQLQLMDMIMQNLRVAVPAIVQTFDPGPPATVSVVVATNEYIKQNVGGSSGPINIQSSAVQLPVLSDVPILIPTGGVWSLTFPINPGDECYVLFADTALDVWLQNGGTNNNPISQRRHSLSDAVAIFGLRSTPYAIKNYSTTSAQLRNDDNTVVIDLASNEITITAPTVTVNAQTVDISGSSSVTLGSHTTIDSHLFTTHQHSGVTTGGGTTGGVV